MSFALSSYVGRRYMLRGIYCTLPEYSSELSLRLKHLNLHGFKTFAPKTDIVFGEGVSAIVGPNGSGKSNVADAIRWALGEQSLLQLRAKRTEDLIFAGSSNRQPLGMAEVAITIDNTDRLLPLDFAEVTLMRRAYRSGENEYYINKSRVRLRDVLDVASTLGQAYTVVGQGLIDAALSLKPDERRELFEEAAAIRGYFVQREDALRRLNKTEENMARVNDLVSELEPQVKRMERQAKQAQEYSKIEADLRAVMQNWYTARWLIACADLELAGRQEDDTRSQVEARKVEVTAKATQLAHVRRTVWELVDTVSALHEQRAQIQARHATQSQLQAVLAERLSSAGAQKQQLSRERETLDTAGGQSRQQLALVEEDVRTALAEVAKLEEAGREVTAQLAKWDAQIRDLRGRLHRESSSLDAANRQMADLHSRRSQSQRTKAEQESAAGDAEGTLAALGNKLALEASSLDEKHSLFLAAKQAVNLAEAEQSSAQLKLTEARSTQRAADAGRRDLQRRMDLLNSQISALAGEQQANLFGGVRAVVGAAREGKLTGYIGTVAELIQVPPDLEAAIESALGGRLQDVVVGAWADAERAIALLKQIGAGRATFLPLDTLRSSPSPTPPKGSGIVGLARDLVEYDPSLAVLAESLMGRLLIVEDLPSARRTVQSVTANAPWTLATLGGEVVRPGGSVTGGSNTRADDQRAKGRTILARERKRRELLATQEESRRELAAADQLLAQTLEFVRVGEAELSKFAAQSEEARKKQVAAQMAHVEQQSVVSRLQQEIAWRTGLVGETRRTIEAQAALLTRLAGQQESLERELEPLKAQFAASEAELQRVNAEREAVAGSASTGQTRLAVLAEALSSRRSRQEDLRREAARYENRMSELTGRLRAAEQEEAGIAGQIEQHAGQVAELAEKLAAIEGTVGPSEHEVRVLEGEVSRVEAEHSSLQSALLEAETALSHASVEKQRCLGVISSLRVEIGEELGRGEVGVETEEERAVAALAADSPSPHNAQPEWTGLHVVWPHALSMQEQPQPNGNGHAAVPTDALRQMERQVYALKAKLSRIGPVNPLALDEFTSLSERHAYLQTQLTDLSIAAEALRRIIGELDRTMRDQFTATFEQVNEKFQYFFNMLFSGGTAKLELTNPQDAGLSGIEISAQPPGKRMQTLAALSGGERALTSAALLFALLKVRPVPFCVLDEVDAALDESNVTRFRSALHELGDKTQFIVITHNRGTIEAAGTLFGVSMAGDGTSQLLSLKVGAQDEA